MKGIAGSEGVVLDAEQRRGCGHTALLIVRALRARREHGTDDKQMIAHVLNTVNGTGKP